MMDTAPRIRSCQRQEYRSHEPAILTGAFISSDADRFPELDLGKVGDKVSQPGDVVFTSKGTVGRLAVCDADNAAVCLLAAVVLLALD